MKNPLQIQYGFSLRAYNTLGIEATAYAYVPVVSPDLLSFFSKAKEIKDLPRLILGGGSNIVLTKNFPGVVLHMCGKGIRIVQEDEHAVYVQAAAGETWHDLVQWTLDHKLPGLENLSLIPGSVGAAPVQNIGAYGAEIKDYFHALTAFDFASQQMFALDKKACCFGYRDSIFKQRMRDKAVIVDVTFALPKRWQANIQYAELAKELEMRKISMPTALDISEAVIAIRTRKLPDPAIIGNAGSFFKNPIVSASLRNELLNRYPQMTSYEQADGTFKLAAGWLIDQCGWKGEGFGNAGVYEKQALVLVNRGGATSGEILQLSQLIQNDVLNKFGVMLEAEPVFI